MITDEQYKVIKMIEENLDISFTGNTKKEASKFINENINESKKVSDYYKQLLKKEYGGYKNIWLLLKELNI